MADQEGESRPRRRELRVLTSTRNGPASSSLKSLYDVLLRRKEPAKFYTVASAVADFLERERRSTALTHFELCRGNRPPEPPAVNVTVLTLASGHQCRRSHRRPEELDRQEAEWLCVRLAPQSCYRQNFICFADVNCPRRDFFDWDGSSFGKAADIHRQNLTGGSRRLR